jgi:glycosyltransferase involved in cell wall biosynthesis
MPSPHPHQRPRRPVRVWIFNHYASSAREMGSVRHVALAQPLVERGADVTIFASGFDHASRQEAWVHGGAASATKVVKGVRVVWLRTWPYRGNDWRRMLNMLSYAVMAPLASAGRPKPDVVVGFTVHPFAALVGWLLARLHGARFIYEVGDLWPQTLIDLGAMSSRSLLARTLYGIESFLVRRSEVVISALPLMAEYLASRGLPTDHIRYIPNGPDIAALDAAAAQVSASPPSSLGTIVAEVRRRQEAGEVVFAYTGAHGRVNRLAVVLEALAIVNRRGAHRVSLYLMGDGPEKPELQTRAQQLSLDNVVFLAPISKSELAVFLSTIDVGVIHTQETPVYRYGISFNKLFDYMAARLPIAFATTTAADPIVATGAGISVSPDDPEALAGAFEALVDAGPDERRRMGEQGRAFAEREHDMAVLGERFADIVWPRDGRLG